MKKINLKIVKTFDSRELTQLMCGDSLEYFSVEAMLEHKKTCDSCADNYAEMTKDEILI